MGESTKRLRYTYELKCETIKNLKTELKDQKYRRITASMQGLSKWLKSADKIVGKVDKSTDKIVGKVNKAADKIVSKVNDVIQPVPDVNRLTKADNRLTKPDNR